jgi:hypothetical protein
MNVVQELEEILLQHCYNMTILKENSNIKKKDSIIDSLIGAIVRFYGEVSADTLFNVKSFINDVENDEVFNIEFFNMGGDIDDYITPKWLNFVKIFWRLRSVGLGTPNSASGEGELMFIFISPRIDKASRGDLLIDGENIEIKGEEVRVLGKVTGTEFLRRTTKLAIQYNLEPNIAQKVNIPAVELEKKIHQEHWQEELMKLSLDDRKSFIKGYLRALNDEMHMVDHLFDYAYLNFDRLRKEIVKILYKYMVSDRSFDKMVILGDGSNSVVLSSDCDKFNEKIDSGEIPLMADYFRINQDAKVGWYIS